MKKTVDGNENIMDSSMTTSQRQESDQAELLQKALQPIVDQLDEVGDEVVM